LLVNLLNPISTYLHILNLDTLIYLRELGDLAKSNLEIYFPAIISWMPLAEANLVIHLPAILSGMSLAEANLVIQLPTILSRMPLAEANLVNHLPAFLSRMPLAEANLVNTLRGKTIFISANRRENHAPASPVLRPPLTEVPILVAPPESQGRFWL